MDALFKGRTTSDCIERPSYIHGFDSRRRKMLVLKNGGEFVHAFAELFVCVCVCVRARAPISSASVRGGECAILLQESQTEILLDCCVPRCVAKFPITI